MARLDSVAENMREPVSAIMTGKATLKRKLDSGFRDNGERSVLLRNFEEFAWWTVPSMFPRANEQSSELGYDYQALGAQLTLNLVSKMMAVMFNPTQPFYKAELTTEQYNVLLQSDQFKDKSAVDAAMANIEKNGIKKFEANGGRAAAIQALTLCIITGNALLWQRDDKYRVLSYRDYDVRYDAWNTMTDMVLREIVQVGNLPDRLYKLLTETYGYDSTAFVELYTGAKRIDGKYVVWQEVEDIAVLDEEYGVYKPEDLPFSPVRWSSSPGRDAGIGLTELLAGDWHMFRTLAETDIDLLALMTDILTLVDTQQGVKVADIQSAQTGGYIAGKKDALTSHSHDVSGSLQDVEVKAAQVIRRLSQAYLFTGNIIRDSERTTAEEVRIVTGEIAQLHMGPYVSLGDGLQRPIATFQLNGAVPALGNIHPQILTGVHELTRAAELDAHRGVWNDLIMLGNIPAHISQYLKIDSQINTIAAGWGVDYSTTINTKAEVDAEQKRVAELEAMAGQQQQ